ncbi:MAG TPA: YdeI/OmpD-associated family protein [Candidatus Syntrophosphaera sp.]|nr:YdeI/OmpD-associated family protein [Candidatus Syntrophosphaera sp.]
MKNPTHPDGAPSRLELDIVLGFEPEYPTSAFLEFPYEVSSVLGGKGRIPVKLIVGCHVFRSSLAPMGGRHMMVFNKQMRDATGFKAGDKIHIILERDNQPREVKITSDVKSALEHSGTWTDFARYSPSHKKELMDWINDAKRPETRARRIAKLIDTLQGGGKL